MRPSGRQAGAHHICVKLDQINFFVSSCILLGGAYVVFKTLHLFRKNFSRLNSVVKSYICVIIPDVVMILNFGPHAIRFWAAGSITDTADCKISAFVAIAQITALQIGSVLIAYTTWRMIQGQRTSDRLILVGYVGGSWVAGLVVASLFLASDSLGPYKDLYCCVREGQYERATVLPVFLITLLSVCSMAGLYTLSYFRLRSLEEGAGGLSTRLQASRVVMRRGLQLVVAFYGCWSIIMINAILTYNGGGVDTAVDMLGAWMAKLMPTIDSVLLLSMLQRVERRVTAKVAPELPPPPPVGAGVLVVHGRGGGEQQVLTKRQLSAVTPKRMDQLQQPPMSPRPPTDRRTAGGADTVVIPAAAFHDKAFDFMSGAEHNEAYTPSQADDSGAEEAGHFAANPSLRRAKKQQGQEPTILHMQEGEVGSEEARRRSASAVSSGYVRPSSIDTRGAQVEEDGLEGGTGLVVVAEVDSAAVLRPRLGAQSSLEGTRRISLALGDSLKKLSTTNTTDAEEGPAAAEGEAVVVVTAPALAPLAMQQHETTNPMAANLGD